MLKKSQKNTYFFFGKSKKKNTYLNVKITFKTIKWVQWGEIISFKSRKNNAIFIQKMKINTIEWDKFGQSVIPLANIFLIKYH